MTAVLGHLKGLVSYPTLRGSVSQLTEQDFPDEYRKWHSCDPFDLFDAPIDIKVAPVSLLILSQKALILSGFAHG